MRVMGIRGRSAAGMAVLLFVCRVWAHAATPHYTVAQDGTGDFNGDTEEPILAAIDLARGGGMVTIKRGVYTIWHTIALDVRRAKQIQSKAGHHSTSFLTSVPEIARKVNRIIPDSFTATFIATIPQRFFATLWMLSPAQVVGR